MNSFVASRFSELATVAGWGPTLKADGSPLCDFPHLEQKDPSRVRVLLLGDSVLDCNKTGQPFEHTIPYQLGQLLGPRFEVINLSAGGWGPDQELLAYEALGKKYQADYVFLFFTPSNDLFNVSSANAIGERHVTKPFFTVDDQGELIYHTPFEPKGGGGF